MADEENAATHFRFPPTEKLVALLRDQAAPIAARMRSIFYLRTLGGADNVAALCAALEDRAGSTLFRHEVAYVLGQLRAPEAIGSLSRVLRDAGEDAIVRHESAEALGAIADAGSLALLDEFSGDVRPEVAETCQIAARRVRWVLDREARGAAAAAAGVGAADARARAVAGAGADAPAADDDERVDQNPYESVDPAPAKRKPLNTEVPAIQKVLVDQAVPLFERYKAMFSLRNCGSRGAVLALCTGLKDPSPLFRHEVAYVLGQLSHAAATEALKARVADEAEHDMVRHEAAEALGAIGTPEATAFLGLFAQAGGSGEAGRMLRESVAVALDAADYFGADGKDETS
jgi:deoxyhypusine monooxygenase